MTLHYLTIYINRYRVSPLGWYIYKTLYAEKPGLAHWWYCLDRSTLSTKSKIEALKLKGII